MKKILQIITLIIIFQSSFSYAIAQETLVDKHLGNKIIQGLKYVDDSVVKFLDIYNKKYKTHWKSLQPDPRIIVYKCNLPMKAVWESKVNNLDQKIFYVKVTCDQTVQGVSFKDTWTIYVPTTRLY